MVNNMNKDVKDQAVQTGTLELTYTDGPEIVMNNIKPGATVTKEISVKNTGTLNTSKVTSSDYMFNDSTNLVGGNGTEYNNFYIDKTYARIDTDGTPGYFTLKTN